MPRHRQVYGELIRELVARLLAGWSTVAEPVLRGQGVGPIGLFGSLRWMWLKWWVWDGRFG